MPTYFRFSNSLQSIRSQQFTEWNGTLFFGAWYESAAFEVSGSAVVAVSAFSGARSVNSFGYAGMITDTLSGAVLTSYAPLLTLYPSGGAMSGFAIPSSGAILNSTWVVASSDDVFVTDVSGNVYSATQESDILSAPDVLSLSNIFATSGTTYVYLGTFGSAVRGLTYDSSATLLYAVSSNTNMLNSFNTTSYASGTLACPIYKTIALASSGALIAAGGWSPLYASGSFISVSLDPTNSSIFASTASGSGIVSIYTADASGNWSQAANAAVSGKPTSVIFTPIANTLFAADPVSGVVDVLTYITSVLTASQTLAISGANNVAITTNSASGLVLQNSQNKLTAIYVSGSTWATSGSALTLAAPNVALGLSSTQIVVGFASGLAYYTLSASGIWTQTSSAATIAPVTALAQDNIGNLIYAGSGYVATAAGSAAFSGSASGIVWQQGQILVGDSVNSAVHVFADASYGISLQKTYTTVSGLITIAQAPSGIFAITSGYVYPLTMTAPYTLTQTQSGAVSVYNGSAWSSTALNAGNVPEAITFDPFGNVTVATLGNKLYTISTTGGVISSAQITVFSGQVQSTSLGISSLGWYGGVLYGTSTQNECFAQVSP